MTEACFVLLTASGLCLTFSAIVAFYAIKTLREARICFSFILDFLHTRSLKNLKSPNNAKDYPVNKKFTERISVAFRRRR